MQQTTLLQTIITFGISYELIILFIFGCTATILNSLNTDILFHVEFLHKVAQMNKIVEVRSF